jgi:small multidrug resistance family-3 protein
MGRSGWRYSLWQWLREGKSAFFGFLGLAALAPYGLIQKRQPFTFGRAFAAYGGVFIVTATLRGWWVNGRAPDRFDWLGGAICLAGAAVILWAP